MSAATDEKPKKKGGKLPIILALLLVLGGGGFFVMKGKGKPKPATTIAISDEEVELESEFLVNMADGRTYLRAKIAFKLRKDFKKEEFEKAKGEVADAVNIALKTTDPQETRTEADMRRLKRKIAAAVNRSLGSAKPEEPEKPAEGGTKEVNLAEKKPPEGAKEEIPEDWDSLKGPVLKVLFVAFATQ